MKSNVRVRAWMAVAVLALAGLLVGPTGAAHADPVPPGPCAAGYVAMSFDDGPSTLTPAYIRALNDAGWVKATFFLEGAHALDHPQYVQQLAGAGHWIGNHSFSHPFLDQVGEPDAFNELLGTNQIIQSQTGHAPTLFRPPYGRTNPQIRQDATTLGMTEALWTTDSFDYNGISADDIVANALTVGPGGIILMHEGYQSTLAAIPRIVDGLAERGLCAGKIVPSATPVEAWPGTTYYATAAHW